jgi:hypothetical protein
MPCTSCITAIRRRKPHNMGAYSEVSSCEIEIILDGQKWAVLSSHISVFLPTENLIVNYRNILEMKIAGRLTRRPHFCSLLSINKRKQPLWLLLRKRTTRPPLVCEVSANFSNRVVSRGQRNGSSRLLISAKCTGGVTPHEAEWTPFQTSLLPRRSNPGPLGL